MQDGTGGMAQAGWCSQGSAGRCRTGQDKRAQDITAHLAIRATTGRQHVCTARPTGGGASAQGGAWLVWKWAGLRSQGAGLQRQVGWEGTESMPGLRRVPLTLQDMMVVGVTLARWITLSGALPYSCPLQECESPRPMSTHSPFCILQGPHVPSHWVGFLRVAAQPLSVSGLSHMFGQWLQIPPHALFHGLPYTLSPTLAGCGGQLHALGEGCMPSLHAFPARATWGCC